MSAWSAALLAAVAVVVLGLRTRPVQRSRSQVRDRGSSPNLALVAAAAAAGSLAVAAGVAAVTTIVIAGAAGASLLTHRQRSRTRLIDRRRATVVDLTYALAAELRAGRRPDEAITLAASVAAADGDLQAALARGPTGPAAAIAGLVAAAELPGAERLRYVAAALGVAQAAGGRVATALERLGAGMDGDEELRGELDAALAGPRASMLMLAALPLLGIGLGQAMGAAPLRLLLHRPLGWGLLAAGAVLDLIGVMVVRLITYSALRC